MYKHTSVLAALPTHQRYLRELLLLQVLCDSGVKVHCVTFVQAVNLASLLDLHVPINQDEFADCLMSKKQILLQRTSVKKIVCKIYFNVKHRTKRVLTGSSMKPLTPRPVEITIMVALP